MANAGPKLQWECQASALAALSVIFVTCLYVFVLEHMALSLYVLAMCSSVPVSLFPSPTPHALLFSAPFIRVLLPSCFASSLYTFYVPFCPIKCFLEYIIPHYFD